MKYQEFLDKANPHGWLLVAESLFEQASELHRTKSAKIIHKDYRTGYKVENFTANRSMFLLGGFSLENAIKSFLVYENPEWVSNGCLSKRLRSHKLLELKDICREIPYPKKYDKTIAAFEEGLESWARYPCGLNSNDIAHESLLDEKLWLRYENLMKTYIKKMESLLTIGWKGPNEYTCQFEFKHFA